ncbi:unnamed protein product [Musa acuminata var. zebrina]
MVVVLSRLQAGVLEQGPWGGNGGKTWDIGQADHISNVKIHYIDAVFAFDFTFTVDGVTKTIHVGGDAPQYNEIILEEDEYFTSISGYFHALSNYQGHAIVMLLTLDTNKGASISVGNKIGSSFALTLEEGSKILGFFGRAGTAIDAIGIRCSLPN